SSFEKRWMNRESRSLTSRTGTWLRNCGETSGWAKARPKPSRSLWRRKLRSLVLTTRMGSTHASYSAFRSLRPSLSWFECAGKGCFRRVKLLLSSPRWQRMGVIKSQLWKMPDGNWRQRHDEDHEYPNGS